ncbi:MAG: hypothetical protein ABEJ27_01105 [Halodesulfurarchaeum sp.]
MDGPSAPDTINVLPSVVFHRPSSERIVPIDRFVARETLHAYLVALALAAVSTLAVRMNIPQVEEKSNGKASDIDMAFPIDGMVQS